jgi:hypothetical protein
MTISQERPGSPHRSPLPAASPLPPYARTRRVVSWLALGLAVAEVILGIVAAVTEPPGSYTGWGEILTSTFIIVVPLVAVGLALRSSRRGVAKTTAVLALILAAWVSVTLLGYLFWGGDWNSFTLREKIFDSLAIIPAIAVFLAAFLAELPAFWRRWPGPAPEP